MAWMPSQCRLLVAGRVRCTGYRQRPARPLEWPEQTIGNEPGSGRIWSLVASGGSSVSSVRRRFSGRVAPRNLLKLDKIGATGLSILVGSVQVRLVPPRGRVQMTEVRDGRNERFPVLAGAWQRRCVCKRTDG